jgi:hypothetical protein
MASSDRSMIPKTLMLPRRRRDRRMDVEVYSRNLSGVGLLDSA